MLDFRSAFAFKLILVALVFLLLSVAPVRAATFTANSNATLASAINSANGNSEADTINITANITLSAALPYITSAITVNGGGNTINGNNSVRLFTVTSSGNLTLNNLIVTNGGGKASGGALSVDSASLTLNQVTVSNSSTTLNGGGIFATGGSSVTINRSAIHGNSAIDGGGIFATGGSSVTINNSSIYGNQASDLGGGIYVNGTGTTVELNHVTITGNKTTGSGSSHLGAGIRVWQGTLKLRNSIIYGNTYQSAQQNCQVATNGVTFTVNSNNIIGGGSTANCRANQYVADPKLSSSATGSPPYFTIPRAARPVDRATCLTGNSAFTVDQRGTTRPQGNSCDIGAYELIPAPNASFTAAVDTGNVLRWNFDASGSSGSITSYAWTFGDGNSGTGQTSAHTYSSGGSYTVTLTATGPGGSDSATQSISVSQPVQAPVASFSYSLNGNQASFTSTSTGSNLSFSWDVNGDGAEDYSSNNPSHSYPDLSATYAVTLTVSNSAGSDSATQSIPVTQLLKAQSVAINALARRGSDEDSGPSGSSGSSGASSGSSDNRGIAVFRYSPAQTCQTLQPDIVVNNAGPGTACQRVNQPAGLGHHSLVAAMPYATVDIWGEVLPNTQICFRAASGSIKFVDTAALPRTIADLPPFYHPGLLCASINAPGQVALVAGPPAPVPTAIPPVYQSLQYCMVRTQYILNFRASPGGAVIQPLIPYNVTLTAEARAEGWFKVDYHGQKGWLSADFVETIGLCD